MDEKQVENILRSARSLVGAIIYSSAKNELAFIKDAKDKAKQYEWLYHCTSAVALINILKSKEFWLTNLQLVNDKSEAERINSKEYENTFYVSSFTYDPIVDKAHWEEYGTLKNGVLVAVKQAWFEKKAYFLCSGKHIDDDFFSICQSFDSAIQKKIAEQKNNRIINPFYIASCGFYQVLYDDELVKEIFSKSTISGTFGTITGQNVIPEVAGIIKDCQGICKRGNHKPYKKDWESEKEVRLKVCVHQLDHQKNGNDYHDEMTIPSWFEKMAVPLTQDAFSEVRIRFSPEFENPDGYIKKLRAMLGEHWNIQIF